MLLTGTMDFIATAHFDRHTLRTTPAEPNDQKANYAKGRQEVRPDPKEKLFSFFQGGERFP